MNATEIGLQLRGDPVVIGRTAGELFTDIDHYPDAPLRRNALENYTRELCQVTLNWMATARERELADTHDALLKVLARLGSDHPANRYLADAELLGNRLRALLMTISTFLTTGNLARSLGNLSGRRRETWRRAVEWMRVQRRPVRSSELVDAEIFDAENTANNALNRLAEFGLVEKRTVGGSVLFALSWTGERVARHLESVDADAADTSNRQLARVAPPPPTQTSATAVVTGQPFHPTPPVRQIVRGGRAQPLVAAGFLAEAFDRYHNRPVMVGM